MYFMVREPIAGGSFEPEGLGFAKNIEFLSELIDGRVNIDGMKSIDISLGDIFSVTCDKKNALRGVRLIV